MFIFIILYLLTTSTINLIKHLKLKFGWTTCALLSSVCNIGAK